MASVERMSLLWTLRKWIAPLAMHEDADRRRAREAPRDEPKDGGGGFTVEAPARPEERWACRVCGHESSTGDYCPRCVADTMVKQR